MSQPVSSPSDASGGQFRLSAQHHFNVSAEQVFDAWLDPGTVGQWLFATPDGQMTRVELEPRVGGEFTIVEQRGAIQAEHFGKYVTIKRPQNLVFEFWTDKTSPASLVSIDIVSQPDGCLVTIHHDVDAKWADYADAIKSGWTRILNGLHATRFADR